MKSLKTGLIFLGTIGMLFLGACSNSHQAAHSDHSVTSTSNVSSKASDATHEHSESKSRQIVETEKYHLELASEKEDNNNYLAFYLHKQENHSDTIANAKVMAQVQMPDGSQKTLYFKYDTEDKHYQALLPGAAGQYLVKVTADVNSEKVSGRFTVNQ